jgi:hypothetical protein
MNPIKIKEAIHEAEETLRVAKEKVEATERKAATDKIFARRAKLVFKQARKAARKGRKATKRRKAEVVQAQIALDELKRQITKATRVFPKAKQRGKGQNSGRNGSKKLSAAGTRKKTLAANPRRKVVVSSPARSTTATRPVSAEIITHTARKKPPTFSETNQPDKEVESIEIRTRQEDATTEPAGSRDLGEQRIAPTTTENSGG